MDLIFLSIDFNLITAQHYRVNRYFKTIKLVKKFNFEGKDLKRIIIDLPWTIETFRKILVNLGLGANLGSCCGNIDKKIIISAPANLICGREIIHTCLKGEQWSTSIKKAKKEIKDIFWRKEQKLLGVIIEWIEVDGYRIKNVKLQENNKLKKGTKIALFSVHTSNIYFELISEMIKELDWQLFPIIFIPNLYLLTKSVLNEKDNAVVILVDNNFFEINVIIDGVCQPIWFGQIDQITDLSKKIIDYLSAIEKDQNELIPAMFGKVFFNGCYSELEIKNKIIAPLFQSGYFLDFSLQTIHSAKQKIKGQVINDLFLRYV